MDDQHDELIAIRRRTLLARGLGLGLGVVAANTSMIGSVAAATTLPAPPAGMTRVTLSTGRSYLIRPRADSTPGPAIVGLHGSAHDALNAEATFWSIPGRPDLSGWSTHAALRDYTLVLGEAQGGNWNVGGGWPGGTQDDEAYLLKVGMNLATQDNVDPTQIFIAGFSAGAAMAWTMAAKYPVMYPACGVFSGWASVYPPTRIDAYHMHGTADTTVPLLGGPGVYGYTFPTIGLESARTTRDSLLIYNLTAGGHATPGWAAQRLYDFFTHDRNR